MSLPRFRKHLYKEHILPGFRKHLYKKHILPGFRKHLYKEHILPGFRKHLYKEYILPGFRKHLYKEQILPGFRNAVPQTQVCLESFTWSRTLVLIRQFPPSSKQTARSTLTTYTPSPLLSQMVYLWRQRTSLPYQIQVVDDCVQWASA